NTRQMDYSSVERFVNLFDALKFEQWFNYNIHSMGKTIAELHAMLKLHEKGAKGKDKGKTKLAYDPKPKIPPSPKRDNPAKDYVCHHCKEVGHWRRNCPSYQAELKKRKNASVASTSDIFTIELYAFPNKTWVYDTGYGTHICNTSQGLRESRKLKHGALSLYMGNGISVLKDNVFYFNASPRDRIYEIDMHNLYPNVSSMFNVSNKRTKHALDSSYLWHFRLGYINKKRIDELQRDGIFCGIVSQLTLPYTPQHNGVSKRRNRTILDMVRSMMNLTTLPKSFWGYALEFAARILNMVLTKKSKKMPYEIWHGKAPKLSYLRDTQRKRWVTTSTIHSRTRFLLLEMLSSLRIASWYKKRVGVMDFSKRVGVTEDLNYFKKKIRNLLKIPAKIPQAPDRYGFYVDVEEYELGDLNEPPNYKATLSYLKFDKWLEAINTKMQSMKENQVWVLVDLPPNGQTVRIKWLFKNKTDMDGNVHTFKARLVAKGYTQTYGVDYG
ncbi:zinc finger, CCHC-type containing protein, partial [Tanacetum coccineum]